MRSVRAPIRARMSQASGLETRRLDPLMREKVLDGSSVDPQHTTDANSVESTVVNQSPDRLGMNTQLVRYFADADKRLVLFIRIRHANPSYLSVRRIAPSSSRTDSDPSNFALTRPSRPTRNVQGS